jgi:ribosome-associated toxin RatA of RatAB toxin-antitoxin module
MNLETLFDPDFVAKDKGTKVTMTIDYEFPYSVFGKLVERFIAMKGFENWMNGGTPRAKEIIEEVLTIVVVKLKFVA